jgi:hypothetical protein
MPFGVHFGKNIKIICKLTQMAILEIPPQIKIWGEVQVW